MIRFFTTILIFTFLSISIFSCSSGGDVKKFEEMDLIAQVLKNYEPDLRYCISLTNNKDEYISDFILLPSGLIYSCKITTKNEKINETTKCMELIFSKVIFPPTKDKKAKQLKRELIFSEIK